MSRSCSSARRSVSRSNFSDLDDGRGIGGRDRGDDGLSGEEGLDLDPEFRRVFVVGDIGPVDMMGEGAWICIDMARVAGARGEWPCLMSRAKVGGRSEEGTELWIWYEYVM